MEILKTIHLVRHGVSIHDNAGMLQSPETELSERGREQALIVSDRLLTTRAEAIISSILPRASETAKIIGKTLGVAVEETPLLIERENPPFVNGKSRTDSEAKKVWEEYRDSFFGQAATHGGESFRELLTRVNAVLELFALRPEERILVVGHGTFFRVLFASVNGVSSEAVFRTYLASTRLENCAVVPLTMVRDVNAVRWDVEPNPEHGFIDRRSTMHE